MIPKISRCGRSFKGIFAYCMHDKGAATSNRVVWTKALNMPDLGKETWRLMVHTVQSAEILKREHGAPRSGRKLERPVLTYSLSWAPDQDPDQSHMEETAIRSIESLGLEEHEAWVVSHNDTAHPNLHIIVNRVHPLTGYTASVDCSAKKLQRFASDYERETKIYCHLREVNRNQDEKKAPPRLSGLQGIWDSGLAGEELLVAFQEEGFLLMKGRKRPVLVSPCDQVFNPIRILNGVTVREFRARLGNIQLKNLPDGFVAPYSHQKSAPKPTSRARSGWLS